jgi:glycerophosphoryl diester phosphodiesterase
MKKFSLVFMIAFVACNAGKKMTSAPVPVFDREGHRGGRGLMPENTIAAMYRGIDEGVNTLELDLHISKDKKVVVSHDPFFNELITTTPEGNFLTKEESRKRLLYNMNYDSIRKYDVGLKPHPDFPRQQKVAAYKPLFSELIEACESYSILKKKKMWYNVEIKSKENTDNINHPAIPEFVDLVVKVLRDKGTENRTVIQSFDMRPLQYLHEHYPNMQTSLLLEAKEKGTVNDFVKKLGFIPVIISPNSALVTKQFVDDAHKLGMRVIPWTVNSLEEIKKLKSLGVNGIISDYPDLFNKM